MGSDPGKGEVTGLLERVLRSGTFSKSARARELLSYLVTEEQNGNGENLKGFVIAVDVLGKDANFDSANDPLVRVHMGRLRELLGTYFETEGRAEPLRISIPVGSYCPVYTRRKVETAAGSVPVSAIAVPGGSGAASAAAAAASTPGDASAQGDANVVRDVVMPRVVQRHLRLYWVALAVIFCAMMTLIGLLVHQNQLLENAGREIAERPAAVNLPSVTVLYEAGQPAALQFAERLSSALSQFDAIDTHAPMPVSGIETTGWMEVDYGLRVTGSGVDPQSGLLLIKAELRNMHDNKVLRAETMPAGVWDREEDTGELAGWLSAVATPEGMIYADLMQRDLVNENLACLLKVRKYYLLRTGEALESAYLCTETAVVEEDTQLGLLHGSYAAMIAEVLAQQWPWWQKTGKKTPTLEEALKHALRGVDLWPSSARSAREVAYIHSRMGEKEQMEQWFRRAYDLNPLDTSIAAAYGYGLVISGKYAEAEAILSGAITATSLHPPWWDYYYSLALLMNGKIDEAGEAQRVLESSRRTAFYIGLALVVAHAGGDMEEADRQAAQLGRLYPDFARHPERYYAERHYPQDLLDRLVEVLKQHRNAFRS